MKLYVPEALLLTVDGDQVPLTAFVDVEGNTGAVVPEQNAGTCVNNGVTLLFTVTVTVVEVVEHPDPLDTTTV